jgi:hypothetical protein
MRKEQNLGEKIGWVFVEHQSIFAPQPHFVSPLVTEADSLLFFGEVPENQATIQEHWTMAHILVEAGWFPSVSEAKKNGGWHNEPIPKGFSCWVNNKRTNCLWVLNIQGETDE